MKKRRVRRLKRRVCVVTGSRADYGLLWWTLKGLSDHPQIQLQLCATGMHLSKEFGKTIDDIRADGFTVTREVPSQLDSDSPGGIAGSIAAGVAGFARAYAELKPDILLLVGDRFEMFAAAVAAVPFGIPIAHCHGGETTVGAIDEVFRHSITKMAHLHFVATPQYRERVLQLGENPCSVFVSGALGLEHLHRSRLLTREELQRILRIQFRRRTVVVTFHPATLEADLAARQFRELLAALSALEDTTVILTKPNADTGSRVLLRMIDDFVNRHPASTAAFASLGSKNYLSLLKHADLVVGNSSSGIIEAPSLGTATVNIGSRQMDRVRAASVIDVEPNRSAILKAIRKALSPAFQRTLTRLRNPYDHGNASEIIIREIARIKLSGLLFKRFYDIPLPRSRVKSTRIGRK